MPQITKTSPVGRDGRKMVNRRWCTRCHREILRSPCKHCGCPEFSLVPLTAQAPKPAERMPAKHGDDSPDDGPPGNVEDFAWDEAEEAKYEDPLYGDDDWD